MNPEFPELDRAELELTRAFTRLCGYLPPPGVTDSAAVAVAERQSELASAIDRAMKVAHDTLQAERDRLGAEITGLHVELRSLRDVPPDAEVSVHPMRLREEYAGDVFNEPPEITDPTSELSGTWFPPGEVPIEHDFVRQGATGLWARTTIPTDPENRLFGYIQKLRGGWCLIVKQSGKLYSTPVRARPQHRFVALR